MGTMRIKQLRYALGITQKELAMELGVDRATVTKWETEAAYPKVRQLPKLADVLQVPIGELFVPYNDTTPREGNSPCRIPTETFTKQPINR